jgi:hypothetical protein
LQAKNATNVEQAFMTMAAEIKNRVGPAAANQAGSAGTGIFYSPILTAGAPWSIFCQKTIFIHTVFLSVTPV